MADKTVTIEYKAKDQTKKATTSVKKGLTSLGNVAKSVGPLVTGALGAAAVKAVFNTTASFQKLNAMLKTATGSAEAANIAFMNLQDFAASTPFQLDEVVDAFVKMKNLGLDPTDEALTSFGNTAVAMGKDLNQMIEAVADASTGEFERLKEFGIKSKSEGDKVSFTFQGITTTVKKNAEEITGFLQDIGTNNFGGSMAEQMDTINGAVSNLQDNLAQLFNLNKDNANLITDWLQDASFLISELNRAISGSTIADRLGEINTEILNTREALKDARAEAAEDGGFFGSIFTVDKDSILSDVNLLEARLEDLNRRKAGIQAEGSSATAGGGNVVAAAQEETFSLGEEMQLRFMQQQEGLQALADFEVNLAETTAAKTEIINRAQMESEAMLQQARLAQWGQLAGGLSSIQQGIAANAASGDTALLNAAKVTGAAIATVNTIAAAVHAMNDPTAITPLQKFANYAVVLGQGLSAVAAIRGVAMGSSGGTTGGGGAPGGAAPIVQPQAADPEPTGGTTVIFEGDFYGDEAMIENKLIPLINQAQGRGVTIDVRG